MHFRAESVFGSAHKERRSYPLRSVANRSSSHAMVLLGKAASVAHCSSKRRLDGRELTLERGDVVLLLSSLLF